MDINTISEGFLAELPIGIVLLDTDVTVLDANNYMFRYFDRDKNIGEEIKFGNAFFCANAMNGEFECGTGETCGDCSMRKAISKFFNYDSSLDESEVRHSFVMNGRESAKWFTLHATPIDKDGKRYALISFTDITNRKKREDELIRMGITDGLTGLYNREFIMKQIEVLRKEMADDSCISIAMMDIDDFKTINDQFGHVAGDSVLITLADNMVKATRSTDFSGRFGGDEFIMVLVDTNAQNTKLVLKRIAEVFARTTKEWVGKEATFSAGVVQVNKRDETVALEDLIKSADVLLYKAKNDSKNKIEV